MGSEIIRPHPLRLKQWEVCKGRILAKMQSLAEFNAKTVKEMIPDIRIIKENKLWEHGGYESFAHFCTKAIGVTKQHIYKLLQDDAETLKVLEINGTESSDLTFCGQTVTPQIPASSEPPHTSAQAEAKPLNNPPATSKKARKTKPEPVEATFTEPTPAITAEVTKSEAIEQAMNSMSEEEMEKHRVLGMKRAGLCPHCGGAI